MSNRKRADEALRCEQIGKAITDLRLSRGYSRQEVARQIGVTHQQLCKYETAQNRISVPRLEKIAKILDVPLAYFLVDDVCIKETHRLRLTLEVMRNFNMLEDEEVQVSIAALVRKLVKV